MFVSRNRRESVRSAVRSTRRRRRLIVEHLHERQMLAGDWHNAAEPLDVNEDLQITAVDALHVINWVNGASFGVNASPPPSFALDVTGDGEITALDALRVINGLKYANETSVMRLSRDTAPSQTTNRDMITNEAGIVGVIRLPSELLQDESIVSLRITEFDRTTHELSLNAYRSGNRFTVPSSRMRNFHDGSNGRSFDPQPTLVELIAGSASEPLEDRRVLADLSYTLDQQPPSLILPRSISPESPTVSLTAIDPSGVDIETDHVIRWRAGNEVESQGLTSDLVQRQGNQTDFALAVDSIVNDAGFHIHVQADIEDIAGNRQSYDLRHFIDRASPIELPSEALADSTKSTFANWSLIQPDRGYGFGDDIATVRAGQAVAVRIENHQTIRHLDQDNWFNDEVRPHFIPSTWEMVSGTLEFQTHDDGVSGDLVAEGGSLGSLRVVPSDESFARAEFDGTWYHDTYGGGFTSTKSLAYRFLTPDEIEQRTRFTREEVSTWPRLNKQTTAPKFGFTTAVLAGPDGVSGPIEIQQAHVGTSDVEYFALLPSSDAPLSSENATRPGDMLLVDRNDLRRLDFRTAELAWEVDLKTLIEADRQAFALPNEPLHVCGLFVLSSDHLAPLLDRFGGPDTPLEANIIGIAVADPLGQDRLYAIDPQSGAFLGRLDVSRVPDLLDHHWVTVSEPTLGTLFQISSQERTWRRVSLAEGAIVESGPFAMDAGLLTHLPETAETVLIRSHDNPRNNQVVWRLDPDDGGETSPRQFAPTTFLADRVSASSVSLHAGTAAGGNAFDAWGNTVERRSIVEVDYARTTIDRVLARASVGQAFNDDAITPTANVGDLIVVEGRGFHDEFDAQLEFPLAHQDLSNAQNVFIRGVQRVQPQWVSTDGRQAAYRVPENATSGKIGLVFSDEQFELSIVPRIASPNRWGEDFSLSDDAARRFVLTGLPPEQFQLRIDDVMAAGCADFDIAQSCDLIVPLLEPNLHRNEVSHSIELITPSGRHRLTLSNDSADELSVDVINSHQLIRADFGTRFVNSDVGQTLAESSAVPAGSVIAIDVNPDSLARDSETEALPTRIEVRIRSDQPMMNNQVTRLVQAYADQTTVGRYNLTLPVTFSGGDLRISPASLQESVIPTIYPLEIQPTAVAFSGDSRFAGGTLLLAGINLDQATIEIDGVVAEVEIGPRLEKWGLATHFITIPESVTEGLVVLRQENWAAESPPIERWWDANWFPVAEVGEPKYPDLPSANVTQSYYVPVNEDQINNLTLNNRYLLDHQRQGTYRIYDPVELPDERIGVRANGNVIGFGDGTDFVVVLPVPEIDDISLTQARVNDWNTEAVLTIGSETLFRESTPIKSFSLQWGDYRTDALSLDRRYRTDVSTSVSLSDRLGSETDSPVVLSSSIRAVGIPLSAIPVLPDDPFVLESNFGRHAFQGVSNPEGDQWLASLVAEKGTPADPNLPSANPGQRINRNLGDSLVLSRLASREAGDLQRYSDGDRPLIPWDVTSGPVRFGLFGMDQTLQVVPSIRVIERPDLSIRILGCVPGDILEVGESSIILQPSDFNETAPGLAELSFDDARILNLPVSDLQTGFVAVSIGGRSENTRLSSIFSANAVGSDVTASEIGWVVGRDARLDVWGIGLPAIQAFVDARDSSGQFQKFELVPVATPEDVYPVQAISGKGFDIRSFELPDGVESGRIYKLSFRGVFEDATTTSRWIGSLERLPGLILR